MMHRRSVNGYYMQKLTQCAFIWLTKIPVFAAWLILLLMSGAGFSFALPELRVRAGFEILYFKRTAAAAHCDRQKRFTAWP